MTERAETTRRDDRDDKTPDAITRNQTPNREPPKWNAKPDIAGAIVQAKMAVGPAADPYEREADAVAARVVRALRSDSSNAATPTADPGPRVQRSELANDGNGDADDDGNGNGASINVGGRLRRAAPTGGAVHAAINVRRIQRSSNAGATTIGAEGGDLDADTTRLLRSSRSGGKPLADPTRTKMESAFGADFSDIRVHSGPTSTELNDRIQAKAFTTGSDIFFRDSVPDASSAGGQELLAHELTHTIQQGTAPMRRDLALHRTARTVQRWPWSKKKVAPVAQEISGPMGASMLGSNDILAGNAAQGRNAKPIANPKINAPGNAPSKGDPGISAPMGISGPMGVGDRPAGWYANGGNQMGSTAASGEGAPHGAAWNKHAGSKEVEIAKPTAVAVGAGMGEGASALAGGGGGAMPVVGLALLGDAAMTINNGRKLKQEGVEHGDKATTKMGGRKQGAGAVDGTSAAISTASSGVNVANIAAAGVGASAAELSLTSLGGAVGGLSVASGSIMVVQGAWRGGKAAAALCRLKWGRAAEMLSDAGERWKEYVKNREWQKVKINAAKIALGALGIVGGALVLASNPIGWAVALAAGIAGGIWAIGKIRAKYKDAAAKEKARNEILAGKSAADVFDAEAFIAEAARQRPEGEPPPKYATPGASNDRRKAIEEANEVARAASKNAQIAHEMRTALQGDVQRDLIQQYLDLSETPKDDDDMFGAGNISGFMAYQQAEELKGRMKIDDRQFHDALVILSSINVDYEQATSTSGQDLIEVKLNPTEAM